jgi:hypothetical protein
VNERFIDKEHTSLQQEERQRAMRKDQRNKTMENGQLYEPEGIK